ncbi:MAG: HEAT repeat domain-containing protein [Elusimicrobiota bacterium]
MNPEIFFRISLGVTIFLGGFVLLLALALVLSKSSRRLWAKYAEKRKAFYIPLILQAVADESDAHPFAILAKIRLGDWRIVENYLLDCASTVSGFGLRRLCEIFEREGFADYELRRLRSWRWWVRASAAKRLGSMLCHKAAAPLTVLLHDRSLEVRLTACWALGRLGEIGVVEEMLQFLSSHSRLAALSLANIIRLMGERTVPILEGLLHCADDNVRVMAINLLGEFQDRGAQALLLPHLSSPNTEVKIAVCRALAALGERSVGAHLVPLLAAESWEIRAKAAWALGKLGYQESIPQLIVSLGDRAWWVRLNTGEALARMGQTGRRALEESLSHRDRFARDMAAQWLDELASGAVS